ncbi:DUF3396 domain-containing protein [Corallococcus sp. AB004]|uniref:type VI immunity family protein n=1 Tax=Corallococcus sp. AB038B TaxID=2316718 RepID=UPI000EA3049B|nr:type VI immunity family protein [Corallococcus sp. AB038B]RKI00162.1 DUF3396 domain-containing protein [Corallococcus sp. AB038B]RKI36541.1 DUF3396 domain-containing protein [Corallococcus sp. AB004]
MTRSHPYIRDGVSIAFYLRHSHHDITQRIEHILHVFQHAIAPASLDWYCDYEEDFQLALKLAADLPFASGHGGLAFNAELGLLEVDEWIQRERLRHPGMDVPDESASLHLGKHVRGAHWMNFLGPPVLTELRVDAEAQRRWERRFLD